MTLTNEHIEIMRHARDRAPGGFYCGDSPQMKELVSEGLMAFAGRKSFVTDPYFCLTGEGRKVLRNLPPAANESSTEAVGRR